jgi:prepilin-type N-terminal cleavage/methylation domain-containing protein
MTISKLNGKGFTLVELMLAMALFSVILVVSTAGFIGINRTYTRGVIKKQLSESIQKISSDVTTLVQIQPAGSVIFCNENDHPPTRQDCPPLASYTYNVLCFAGQRYYWPSSGSGLGGLYKDSNDCSDSTFDKSVEIVDTRYAVEEFKIVPLTNELYQLRGVLHTTNINALTTSDNNGVYSTQRSTPGFDPYLTKCKGSSAGSIVQTCAVEMFDFVINSRGNN